MYCGQQNALKNLALVHHQLGTHADATLQEGKQQLDQRNVVRSIKMKSGSTCCSSSG
jgi:hypothetical protein